MKGLSLKQGAAPSSCRACLIKRGFKPKKVNKERFWSAKQEEEIIAGQPKKRAPLYL